MKKTKLVNLASIALVALIISSCGGINKMKETAEELKYEVSPDPLVMKGGEVDYSVEAFFPEKYFNKKATLTVTPVLKYGEQRLELEPKVLQGEDVEANNEVIKYVEGGSTSMSGSFDYSEDMLRSELYVDMAATFKEETVPFGEYKIADGIIATENLVQVTPEVILIPDKFQRIIESMYVADIHYQIERSNIRSSELRETDIDSLNAFLEDANSDERKELKGLTVSAYASPDGPMDLNERLSEDRQESARRYIEREMKRGDIEKAGEEDFFSLMKTAEDWEGFKELVQESDIEDKELILRVLSMYSDPEVREKEIKNLSATYEELADEILPKLRRSKLVAEADLIGYSDEELLGLIDTKIDTLNIEELLYAATLTDDVDKKIVIYTRASEDYPDNVRARNNLGFAYMLKGEYSSAKGAFEGAKEIEENDVVKNNLAAIALIEGDVDVAEELLTAAMGAGEEVSYNLGIVNILKGNYEAAVNYFGNACGFNPALAKVLNDQNEAALTSINCIDDPDAMDYYLKAVVGAKTTNDDMVFSNLRTAIGMDSDLKAHAKKDLQFYQYFENDAFKSIVE